MFYSNFECITRKYVHWIFFIKLVKAQLVTQFKDVPERIIVMALESVEYSEDRAIQILKIVMQEDTKVVDTTVEKQEVNQEEEGKIDEGLRWDFEVLIILIVVKSNT